MGWFFTYQRRSKDEIRNEYFYGLHMVKKVLLATEKPFAAKAVEGIRNIFEEAGYELRLLEKYTDKAQLLEAVADVDALIVRSDKVTAEVLAAAENLKIVVRAGAGYDNIDLAAATEKGVVVMNTPGQNSNAVAELVIGMMIYMSRNQFTPGTGAEIKGKRLGLHAFGNVARIVARYGKAFGMEVKAFDPFVIPAFWDPARRRYFPPPLRSSARCSGIFGSAVPGTSQGVPCLMQPMNNE